MRIVFKFLFQMHEKKPCFHQKEPTLGIYEAVLMFQRISQNMIDVLNVMRELYRVEINWYIDRLLTNSIQPEHDFHSSTRKTVLFRFELIRKWKIINAS